MKSKKSFPSPCTLPELTKIISSGDVKSAQKEIKIYKDWGAICGRDALNLYNKETSSRNDFGFKKVEDSPLGSAIKSQNPAMVFLVLTQLPECPLTTLYGTERSPNSPWFQLSNIKSNEIRKQICNMLVTYEANRIQENNTLSNIDKELTLHNVIKLLIVNNLPITTLQNILEPIDESTKAKIAKDVLQLVTVLGNQAMVYCETLSEYAGNDTSETPVANFNPYAEKITTAKWVAQQWLTSPSAVVSILETPSNLIGALLDENAPLNNFIEKQFIGEQ